MKFCVVNLGCKVNRVESDAAAAALIAQGATAVSQSQADLIVVNTCTVTGEAEKKARKAIHKALRENDSAQILVTGCACAIDPEFYESLDDRVCVVPKADLLASLVEISEEKNADQKSNILAEEEGEQKDAPPPEEKNNQKGDTSQRRSDVLLRTGRGFPTRVGVKVQDGCDNACTYCIVHVARGRSISRPATEIISECVELASAGVKEIVLTGINLGSYCDNSNVKEGDALGLSELLCRLLHDTKDLHAPDEMPCRFRISSIEPRNVDERLIELLDSAAGRICRHLHLPLQSGCNKVLHEMARPYSTDEYLELIDALRKKNPSISITTDVIVGFPGERDEDFEDTLRLCRRCNFSKIHVFPYSRRENTPAAGRTDQISAAVKTARASELRALADNLRTQEFVRREGSTENVLVEQNGLAMTESYYEIKAPEHAPVGALIPLQL